jgi:hypothetical protein
MSVPRILVVQDYWADIGFLRPLEGVKICAIDTEDCVWTDDEGRAVVQVPVDREYAFALEKEGYCPELWVDSRVPGLGMRLFPEEAVSRDELLAIEHHLGGFPYPMQGTGSVLVIPLDGWFSTRTLGPLGTAGRTFELINGEGKAYYYDEQGYWDATLTATSRWGWGGFAEVPPGEVEIRVGGTSERCVVWHGWPGTIENSIRMPIRAGFLTNVWVDCWPPCDTLTTPPPGCHDPCPSGSDSECEPGTFCFYGTCEAQCTATEECGLGLECNARGTCE